MRLIEVIVEVLFWLAIFISPTIIGLISGLIVFLATNNIALTAIPVLIGLLLGILLAERIRRKYGCSNFISRLRR